MSNRVFISHSSKDDTFVDKLVNDLERHQVETFVDHRDITIASRWNERVQQELERCSQMIAVISPNSNQSRNCHNEWYTFINTRKEIIPVWLSGDAMYFEFATIQYTDFRKQYAEPLKNVLRYLKDKDVNSVNLSGLDIPSDAHPTTLASQLYSQYHLKAAPGKSVGIATGNLAELTGVDILVNSENNQLEMDATFHQSVSAALNAAGAKWDERGNWIEKTIDLELQAIRRDLELPLKPGAVVVTSPGSLRKVGVRYILHVVAVVSKRNWGVQPATPLRLAECVTNVLSRIDELSNEKEPLKTVAFPILAAGEGGIKVSDIAQRLIESAVRYLEDVNTSLEAVYFVAYNKENLEALEASFKAIPELGYPQQIHNLKYQE